MEIFSVLCLLVQLFLLTRNIHSLFIMTRLKIDDVIQNHLNEKLLMRYVFAWLMGDSSFNLLSRPTTEMRMFKNLSAYAFRSSLLHIWRTAELNDCFIKL